MSTSSLEAALSQRSQGKCELCTASGADVPTPVPPRDTAGDATVHVLLCGPCAGRISADALDGNHWRCLQEAIWSEVPAVQVLSWRLASRLAAEGWAAELLDQVYLSDDVAAWARDQAPADEAPVKVVDSNGTELRDGDSVTLIKDLDVKGTSFVAKRGTTVKNIRLGDDPEHVEGRVNKVSIYLKTCFLRRLS